ncbi:MAG: BLUF domain-containing protein [Pseudomonas sp.]
MNSAEATRQPPIFAIAYTSRARRPMTVAEVDQLVIDANAHNAMHQVTGVLLHDGNRFFQYFEGPRPGVDAVYARIRRSSKHVILAENFNGLSARRYFAQWYMASKVAGRDTLLQLGSARWSAVVASTRLQAGQSPGLARLLEFWNDSPSAEKTPP